MADSSIRCPKCGAEIPLTEALTGPIRETLRAELEADVKARETQALQREKDIATKEAQVIREKRDIETEVVSRVEIERKKLAEEELAKAQKSVTLEMEDLQDQLREKDKKLDEAKKTELSFRKRERKLEEGKANLELDVERKLAQEREKIRKDAIADTSEKHQLRIADYENTIKGMKDQITTLQQKAEQGSQQAQGETLETELENLLISTFPDDNIRPVPKGVSGADVIQEVCNSTGQPCGTIIWESKRTKNWSTGWVEKLKADQRKAKADVAIILTASMPKTVENFGSVDGVWVTDYRSSIGLAAVLRQWVIQLASSRAASIGKGKKMEFLYTYLSGSEFRGRVEAIVEAFTSLKKGLDKERIAVTKLWAQREKQIEKVMINTVGMYGDFQGIIGASLPEIEQLEIKALPDAEA